MTCSTIHTGKPKREGWYQASSATEERRLTRKWASFWMDSMNTSVKNATWLDWWHFHDGAWWNNDSKDAVKASCQDMCYFGVLKEE